MGKKKPFIDRKSASTYHVVRRSQRDVGGEYIVDDSTGEVVEGVPSDFVLMPGPRNDSRIDEAVLGGGDGGGDPGAVPEDAEPAEGDDDNDNDDLDAGGPDGVGVMSKLRSKVKRAGLVNDEYNYDRHLLPITGSGVFFSGDTGRSANGTVDPRSRTVVDEDEVLASKRRAAEALSRGGGAARRGGAQEIKEVGRQLDSIALTPECMDDDVAQALFGEIEEGDFEEILDDFCFTAAQEPEEAEDEGGEGADGGEGAFDYDAHIRSLIDKAERQRLGDNYDGRGMNVPDGHAAAAGDMAFFQGAKDIRRGCPGDEDDVDDDEDSLDREFGGDDDDGHDDVANLHRVEATPGVVPALAPDEEKALADKFLQTLAEYDSDDVGDLDDHHDECRGDVMLEGDARLEATFDEFLTEKKDEIFVEGTSHLAEKRREGGSSYAALVGRTMVHVSQLGEAGPVGVADERPQDLRDVMAEADATLASPEMEPPAEEVLIDGKSYFSQASRNPWDCESILSTYSNLDNNPAMVGRSGRGRRRRKGGSGKKKGSKEFGAGMGPEGVPEDEPVKIVLSSKTGLPLSAFDKEGTGGNPDAAADHRFAPPREGGVHPEYCDDDGREYDEYGEDMDDTYLSVNLGEKRDKTESKMDKKARKVAVKEERRVARIQKKMMREAFGDEFARRSGANAEDDVAGKSVFRYS